MNLSQIKNRLNDLQPKKYEDRKRIDYSKIFWKPTPGEYQVRIVPYKFNKDYPFSEVYYHFVLGKGFPSPMNWQEPDALIEFSDILLKESRELQKNGTPNELWKKARRFKPTLRVIMPIIIRGRENEGVIFAQIGKEVYEELLKIAQDEDWGDYTDVHEGRDFTVNAVLAPSGKGSVLKFTPKPKQTPLHQDATMVAKFLDEQTDIMEFLHGLTKSYVELKDMVQQIMEHDQNGSNEMSSVSVPKVNAPAPQEAPAPVVAPIVQENAVPSAPVAASSVEEDEDDDLFS